MEPRITNIQLLRDWGIRNYAGEYLPVQSKIRPVIGKFARGYASPHSYNWDDCVLYVEYETNKFRHDIIANQTLIRLKNIQNDLENTTPVDNFHKLIL